MARDKSLASVSPPFWPYREEKGLRQKLQWQKRGTEGEGRGQSTEPAAEARTELGLAGEGGGGPLEASLLPGSGLSRLTAHPYPEEATQTPAQATHSPCSEVTKMTQTGA